MLEMYTSQGREILGVAGGLHSSGSVIFFFKEMILPSCKKIINGAKRYNIILSFSLIFYF